MRVLARHSVVARSVPNGSRVYPEVMEQAPQRRVGQVVDKSTGERQPFPSSALGFWLASADTVAHRGSREQYPRDRLTGDQAGRDTPATPRSRRLRMSRW